MEDLQKCPTYQERNSSYTTSTQIACPLLSGTRLPVEVHNALRGAGSSCLDSGRGDGRGMVGGFARQLVKCPQKRPVLMTAMRWRVRCSRSRLVTGDDGAEAIPRSGQLAIEC